MYKKIIKPILFLFPPDFIHNTTVRAGRVVQVLPPVRWILRKWWAYSDARLNQSILDIDFSNPIGLSAGFDKNVQLTPLMSSVGFGFETGGSVTLGERKGNARPWFYRLPKTQSLVVHAGLANRGIVNGEATIIKNSRRSKNLPLFISVAIVAKTSKETCQDAIIDAKNTILYILQHSLSKAIEINISCPNAGDEQPFTNPKMLDELLTELDKIERNLPFLIKMPQVSSLKEFDALLRIVDRHNIQGLTIANLVKDRSSVKLLEELPEEVKGGLSGAPTRKVSTAMVHYAYKKYAKRFTIIGVGGVFSAEHAYEKIRAGASLVGMITGVIFEGPQVVGKINKGLIKLLEEDGFTSITEAIGADHKKVRNLSKKSCKTSSERV